MVYTGGGGGVNITFKNFKNSLQDVLKRTVIANASICDLNCMMECNTGMQLYLLKSSLRTIVVNLLFKYVISFETEINKRVSLLFKTLHKSHRSLRIKDVRGL